MSIVALDGLHVGELEIRRTRTPQELLDIVDFYVSSFPFVERRTVESMSRLLTNERVYFYRVFLNARCIGMMHFWILDDVVYCEHFAVVSPLRNKGYGRQLLRLILANVEKPFIVEVEPPVDELSERRLKFYEREGLVVVAKDYIQPPYHAAGASTSLFLMSNDPHLSSQSLQRAIAQLQVLVYRYNKESGKLY